MDWEKVQSYWTEEADEALGVAENLFEKEDFSYSLFFGHLAVEKLLKAVFVNKKKEHAPYIHNLKRLAGIAGLQITVERSNELLKISTYNLEARYPDINRAFRKKCTPDFTEKELNNIREVFEWLKLML